MIPFHPLADLFPMIEGGDFDDLVEDIRENGIRDAIVLHGGMILEGRNRYRALQELRNTGEVRGAGWGGYAGHAIGDDDLEPDTTLPWFEAYSPMMSGDPLAYVVSKNLMRRHLTPSQRGMLASDLGKLGWGGDRSKSSREGLTISQRAEMARVGHATVERTDYIREHGVPELQDAVRKGDIGARPAAEIAAKPEPEQREEMESRGILPNGARAIMSSRQEPDDSLDYFPTPPWGTRTLIEHVLPAAGVYSYESAWEPACGEGHMAEVLRESFKSVRASDVHDYGYGDCFDYLAGDGSDHGEPVDWIITNPPFDDKALDFALRALAFAKVGVALFVRWQWCEGIGRYEKLFTPHPPTLVAPFVERINLCKGRWEHDGSTATAYCWIVWTHRKIKTPTRLFWIPPNCRVRCSREDDVSRFTTHPVTKRYYEPEAQREDPALAAAPAPSGDEPQASAMSPCTQGDGAVQDRCESTAPPIPDGEHPLDIPAFLRRQPQPAE